MKTVGLTPVRPERDRSRRNLLASTRIPKGDYGYLRLLGAVFETPVTMLTEKLIEALGSIERPGESGAERLLSNADWSGRNTRQASGR